jgi:hypothetical protein
MCCCLTRADVGSTRNRDIAVLVANFRSESDRKAMCSYCIRGDIGVNEPDVGSTVMFGIPPSSGQSSMDESVLEFLHVEIIGEYHRKNGVDNVLNAVCLFPRGRTQLLQAALQTGRINMDIPLACVSPANIHGIGGEPRPDFRLSMSLPISDSGRRWELIRTSSSRDFPAIGHVGIGNMQNGSRLKGESIPSPISSARMPPPMSKSSSGLVWPIYRENGH